MNFRNFGNEPPPPPADGGGAGGGSRLPGTFPLARQSSVYSLTFDEFQSSLAGSGKVDFGSMNMDELLKSIWSAEEIQTTTGMANSSIGQQEAGNPSGYLQRQGSLTLPRTLSQKTVDEVWGDLGKKSGGGNQANNGGGGGGLDLPERQRTLGEITLEEFLVRAGVVREDNNQFQGKPNSSSTGVNLFGDFSRSGANSGSGFGFQEQINNVADRNLGLMGNRVPDVSSNQASNNLPVNGNGVNQNLGLMGNRVPDVSSNQASNNLPVNGNGVNQNLGLMGNRVPDVISNQASNNNLPVNVNGVRSAAQQQLFMPQKQQQQLFPKQPNLGYANPIPVPISTQLGSPRIGGGIVGNSENSKYGNLGMSGLGAGGVTVAMDSPVSDGIGKTSGDTSSVSPVPYVFNNGGLRGRRCGKDVEKVVERRQRRMIKNRESAARSRARKQAYTTELESEVADLKNENEELHKKQAVIFQRQKNQVLEMMNMLQGGKRRCLKRTLTGPW